MAEPLPLRPTAHKPRPHAPLSFDRRKPEHPERDPTADLPNATELDRLFITALNSKLSPEQKLAKLYGPVSATSNPMEVYVDGSCLNNGRHNASAGSGIYWGPNHTWNEAIRVPDNQTNNRGEVYAVLRALQRANMTRTFHIYSDSEYTLETIAIRAPDEASRGWKCPNGDLFQDITKLLKARPAPVVLIQIKGHSGNAHNDAADLLAKQGA
ncbi:ribonuclease H-like domain-containing protein, partial [Mycena sanguinolenta]